MLKSAQEYFRAAIPEPFQILGVRLKPLTLHHCILMQWCGVAFVSQNVSIANSSDLIIGVLICSKNWKEGEFEEYIFSETKRVWWNPLTWKKQSVALLDVQKWGNKAGLFDLQEKTALFKQYIDEQSQEPAFWEGENAGGETGAHWIQCVLLTLTSHLGYSRQEALHSPLPQVLADYFRYAEQNGVVKLMTAEEIEMIEKGGVSV